jgi:DNA polymerase III subunit delta'
MTTAPPVVLETARRGELHHALIFHGPSAPALRDAALATAKALNCLNGSTGDTCPVCHKIDRGIFPDVHLITVADDRKLISVDQIREVVSGAALRPYEGRVKVFIIDPADATSGGAINSLLKTLEEPVEDTVFLLLTRSADLLLPTIRSRSQSIYVGPAIRADRDQAAPLQLRRIRQRAEESGTDREWAEQLAGLVLECLERASRGETAALLNAAAGICAEDEKEAIAVYAGVLRDLAALPSGEFINPESAARIISTYPKERLLAAADVAVRAVPRLAVNADPRLLVEQSLVELTKK